MWELLDRGVEVATRPPAGVLKLFGAGYQVTLATGLRLACYADYVALRRWGYLVLLSRGLPVVVLLELGSTL